MHLHVDIDIEEHGKDDEGTKDTSNHTFNGGIPWYQVGAL